MIEPRHPMQRASFPLYFKVLALFLLNVALLAGGLGFLLRSQFGLGLDSIMSGKSGERIDRALQLISDELTETDRQSWDSQLARFSDAYGVTFSLFRSNGEQVAGVEQQLPDEILAFQKRICLACSTHSTVRTRRGHVSVAVPGWALRL